MTDLPDEPSKNGTNGVRRLRANESDRCSDRSLSVSQIGQFNETTSQSLTQPGVLITLSWIDIRYRMKDPKPGLLSRICRPKQYKAWMEDEGKSILNGVLGEIRPGEIVGIMGGSGAGKTTMLNILAGKVVGGEASGTVIINGKLRDSRTWPYLLGYVEQEDILDDNLTVREMIRFAVDMRNPSKDFYAKKRERKTQKLINALGLESVADRQIGSVEGSGISGGERKRVSIAFALAAERRVLFLDEPTTGLDAATSLGLLKTLTNLAIQHSLSVIMSIHQPSGSMLKQFDKLMLLSLGRTIFYGSTKEITDHFNSQGYFCPPQENPADWILDVITVDNTSGGKYKEESLEAIRSLHREWEIIEQENTKNFSRVSRGSSIRSKKNTSVSRASSILSVETGKSSDSGKTGNSRRSRLRSVTSLFLPKDFDTKEKEEKDFIGFPLGVPEEFRLLFKRYWLIEVRNYYASLFLLGEFLLLSLIFGFVFFQLTRENFGGFQSRIGLFSTIPSLIIGLISIDLMVLFVSKRRLIVRERFSHLYRLSDAYTANVLAIIPVRLFSVTIFSTIIYYLIGLRTDSFVYFLIYLGVILLVTLFAIFFGVMIAASTSGSLMASVVRMLFIYVFLLFGGSRARLADVTPIISWMRFLSPNFYCLQALIQNECIGITIAGEPGIDFVELYDLNQFSIMWNVGALMIMCGATFIAGYIGLKMTTKPRYIVI